MAHVVADVATVRINNAEPLPPQTFTIPGFSARAKGNPKAAIFLVGGNFQDDPEDLQPQGRFSIGFTDGTNQYCGCVQSQNATVRHAARRATSSSRVMMAINNAGTAVSGDSSFSSFVEDGVVIEHQNSFPANNAYAALTLLGGPDLQAFCGEITTGTGIGTETSTTEPGFEPDAIIAFSTDQAAGDPYNEATQSKMLLGIATNDASLTQGSWNTTDRHNQLVSDIYGLPSDTYLLHDMAVGGGLLTAIEVTSFDANGFTVTTRVEGSAHTFYYLALKFNGAKYWMGRKQGLDSTGSQVILSGFKPQWGYAIISQSQGTLETSASGNVNGSIGVGMTGLSEESTIGKFCEDADTLAECKNYGSPNFIYSRRAPDASSLIYTAAIANDASGKFFAGGARVQWTAALSGLTPHIWYFFLEEPITSQGTFTGRSYSLGALAGRTFSLGAAVGTTLGQLGATIANSASLGSAAGATASLGAVMASSSSQEAE